MKNNRKKISAVIACYNDGESIPIMHQRLTKVFLKIDVDYEIIFVNDGSPDNSEEVLYEICLKDDKTIAIIHSRNFSSQNAFTSGMIESSGDAVVLLDGDLQDPPELIENFYKLWVEGYDVVYGVREKRDTTVFLKFAYKLFYRVFKRMAYIQIPIDAGDFSLMDRKVVDAINKIPENDRFVRGLRAWVGFKQIGVSYHRPERMFGKTTNNFFSNFRWARKGIFSFSNVPIEFIIYFSSIIVFISALALLFYIGYYFVNPSAPRGITTIIVLVLFLGGAQLLSISIIAEYIGKILEETKNRPKFIIDKIFNKKSGTPL